MALSVRIVSIHHVVLNQAFRQTLIVLNKHGAEAWPLWTDIGKAQPTRGPSDPPCISILSGTCTSDVDSL